MTQHRFSLPLIGLLLLLVVDLSTDPARCDVTTVNNSPVERRVEVAVYYETLCLDSMHFFQRLLPIWRAYRQFIDLRLIPYGKAIHNRNRNGEWRFQCQHGRRECRRNMLHACLLDELGAERAFPLITCSMKDFTSTEQSCADELSIDLTAAYACANSTSGADLLALHGDQTARVQLSFVPTVTLDGVYDWDTQPDWRNDFKRILCTTFAAKYEERLPNCEQDANNVDNKN